MATKFFKEFWWFFSEGWALAFVRWVEDVSVRSNVYRPVSKIKNTPVSGDALVQYSKERRNSGEDRNL